MKHLRSRYYYYVFLLSWVLSTILFNVVLDTGWPLLIDIITSFPMATLITIYVCSMIHVKVTTPLGLGNYKKDK